MGRGFGPCVAGPPTYGHLNIITTNLQVVRRIRSSLSCTAHSQLIHNSFTNNSQLIHSSLALIHNSFAVVSIQSQHIHSSFTSHLQVVRGIRSSFTAHSHPICKPPWPFNHFSLHLQVLLFIRNSFPVLSQLIHTSFTNHAGHLYVRT